MTFHYLLTLQWPVPEGFQTVTAGGTIDLAGGATRSDIYEHIKSALMRQAGAPPPPLPTTIFFSLEPDHLA